MQEVSSAINELNHVGFFFFFFFSPPLSVIFFVSQVRGHSTALSVGPPSPRRETCFATSNCTPERSLSNARCAATPADDATPSAGTCAPILVAASHMHAFLITQRAHTQRQKRPCIVCTCKQCHVSYSFESRFSLPFESRLVGVCGRALGFSSNSPAVHPCNQHTSHYDIFYSITSGNLLMLFQVTFVFFYFLPAVSLKTKKQKKKHLISFERNCILCEIIHAVPVFMPLMFLVIN